jgi:hypothetical protein
MGSDNIIKKSIEDNVDKLDLPVEKYEKMFDYITSQERAPKRSFIESILQRLNALFRGVNFKEAIGVVAFIMVLILVPTAVKYGRSNDINTAKGYDFSRMLEELVVFEGSKEAETINDEKTIKEKVPFPIEYPKFVPSEYKLDKMNMTIMNDCIGKIYEVKLEYRTTAKKLFVITQSTETAKIVSEESGIQDKISINGIDAYLSESKGKDGFVQLTFCKNGKFYIISASNTGIGKDDIINIAKSLDFSLQGDTRKSYRNGTIEFFDYSDDMKKKLSFAADYPKYIPDGFDSAKPTVVQMNVEGNILSIVQQNYFNNKNDLISISETNDKSKFQNLKGKFKKETIDGIDGWYREDVENNNKIIQIIFSKNEKFYSVYGQNISKEELIKVAKSL